MEFKHLEYFIETSQHQSMSKAAEALYISQQALSRCIANMEQELGVELVFPLGEGNPADGGRKVSV